MKRLVVAIVGALALVLGATSALADNGQNRSDLKNYQHVFVIMMENTSYSSLIGNSNAPWINQTAVTFGVATDYHGVIHPSQPNYVAATSGQTGLDTDADETLDVPNIVDQLEGAGKTWRDYQESLSLCGGNKLAHACGNQLYERKHNPFVSYKDVQTNPARMANVVDLSQLDADLASGNAPDYVWISPNQCNDMHGRFSLDPNDLCSFAHEQNLIATGDAFLHNLVDKITSSSAWTGNSLILIAWDESDFTGSGPFGFGDTSGCCDANPGGGHVLTLAISHSDHAARTSAVAYNHYSLLATIEDGWRLGCLGATCDTAHVPPMSDLVGPRG